MKKILKRSLFMTLVAVLVIGTFATTADAAMKRTVKKQEFTTKRSTANKKAAKVKKGTTLLTYKKGEGYLKFVAPKTKTYTFTFSNYKMDGETTGYIAFSKKSEYNSNSLRRIEVSTEGGKSEVLRMSTTGFKIINTERVADRLLHKRQAKFKLKAGEVVYVYLYSANKKKATMKLKIQ